MHGWLVYAREALVFALSLTWNAIPISSSTASKQCTRAPPLRSPPCLTHLNWSRLTHREACCINKAVAISERFKILLSLGSGITHTPAIYTPQEWHRVLFPTVTHTGIPLHMQCPPMGSTRKGLVLQLGNGIFHISEKIQTALIVCLYQSAKNGYKWNQGCERWIFFIRQMIKT